MNPEHKNTRARVIEKMTTAKPSQGLPIKALINHPYARRDHWYRVYRRFGETYVILKGMEFTVKVNASKDCGSKEQVYLKCMTTEQLQIEIDRRGKNNG